MITIIKNPDVLKAIELGVEAGIATICSNVRSQAVALAPVDTAKLKNSIVWKTSSAGNGEISGEPTPKKMEGYVGTAVEYAVYQEFGTRYTRAQPYLRPAIAIKALGRKGADVLIQRINEMAKGKLTPGNITERETFGVGKLK
jgi:HK97 gp10 family phage protein